MPYVCQLARGRQSEVQSFLLEPSSERASYVSGDAANFYGVVPFWEKLGKLGEKFAFLGVACGDDLVLHVCSP